MTDDEVLLIVKKLKNFCIKEREKGKVLTKIDMTFLGTIDNCCNLTELGILKNRPIGKDEEIYFRGGYHMNFWDSDTQTNLYSPLCREVKDRNWFREEPDWVCKIIATVISYIQRLIRIR
ncbi:hypothetical protein ACLI08_02755 [Flavobacterium sp. RNTU_13]|uniref:hypothetical protein n=1 Tax=Flavobacterium sp. RNTU_13 TaxID=3375145 RepID=UPI003988938A